MTKCWAGFATARDLLRLFVHMGNNNSVKQLAAALGGVFFFNLLIFHNIVTIQYNLIL